MQFRTPALLACGALLIGLGWGAISAADSAQAAEARERLIDEGRYLAIAGDCSACHTRAHGAPFAGGRPLHTPFGVVYSANITTDPMSLVGAAVRTGHARGARSRRHASLPGFPVHRLHQADGPRRARDLRLSAYLAARALRAAEEQHAVSVLRPRPGGRLEPAVLP